MADFALSRIGVSTVIDKNASLADGARAAGDFDNDTDKAIFCDVLLRVYFDTTAPSAGVSIADLFLLYGNGEGSETFPEGGDAAVGNDVTPQGELFVGAFETRVPSTSTEEQLLLRNIPLRVGGTNRFVLRNTSGQTFNAAWQLDIVKYKWTSA